MHRLLRLRKFSGQRLTSQVDHPLLAAIVPGSKMLGALLLSACLWGQPAQAEMRQLRSTLFPKQSETFAELMKRAEATATALIERTFRNNARISELTLTISGDRNGQEAPLLLVSVSRSDWRKTPKLRTWATYFNNFSIALLGYRKPPVPEPVVSAVPQPATPIAPNPATGAPPQPGAPGIPPNVAQTAPPSSLPGGTPIVNLPPILPTSPAVIPSKVPVQNDPAFRDD